MKVLALALVFLALAGCKSGRDYTSANKEGVGFLLETFREGNQLRKKNLKQDLAFSKRAPRAKMVRSSARWDNSRRSPWPAKITE